MAEQKNTLQASHNKKVFAIETGGLISHCGILAVLAVRIWRQLIRQSPCPQPPCSSVLGINSFGSCFCPFPAGGSKG